MKRKLTNLFIIFIIGGSLSVGLFERELDSRFEIPSMEESQLFQDDIFGVRWLPYFPFSSYPLFSDKFDPPKMFHIEARGLNEKGIEIFLPISKFFTPFWRRGLLESLQNHTISGKSIESLTKSLLLLYTQRYNHPWGPFEKAEKLKSLRLYIAKWDWETYLKFRQSHTNLNFQFDWKGTKYAPYHYQMVSEASVE